MNTAHDGSLWVGTHAGLSRVVEGKDGAIHFAHPLTGKPLTLTAPLLEHMARTWDLFGWRPEDAPFDPFEALR